MERVFMAGLLAGVVDVRLVLDRIFFAGRLAVDLVGLDLAWLDGFTEDPALDLVVFAGVVGVVLDPLAEDLVVEVAFFAEGLGLDWAPSTLGSDWVSLVACEVVSTFGAPCICF